ncbi:hypothetical protein AGMMS49546_12940 [Spirochaetia bacterium]|nr:hypothetical protein AGMMS49546_12940 [Spirochaetia bacterium]
MLKLLTDKHRDLKILCSGSSALGTSAEAKGRGSPPDILQQVEESLAGRVRTLEVLSLSFSEYLFFNDPKLAALYETLDMDTGSSPLTAPMEALFLEYLVYGGLPRAALAADREEKIQILDDIYQTYLLKDIRNYISQGDIVGFNKMLRLISAQIGNLLNVNEVSLAAFNHFCDDEAIVNRFILNRTLNTIHREARFLPGFLADRI